LLVGVPADIEAMRLSDPARAAAWRTALRDVLSPLLAGGARVTGFDRTGWYVVSMGWEGTRDEADRG
jgi:predicted GNAT superfamily acetyltransferase